MCIKDTHSNFTVRAWRNNHKQTAQTRFIPTKTTFFFHFESLFLPSFFNKRNALKRTNKMTRWQMERIHSAMTKWRKNEWNVYGTDHKKGNMMWRFSTMMKYQCEISAHQIGCTWHLYRWYVVDGKNFDPKNRMELREEKRKIRKSTSEPYIHSVNGKSIASI